MVIKPEQREGKLREYGESEKEIYIVGQRPTRTKSANGD
jgi:hypothetical protein